jgi:hypothetical protein
MFVCREIEKNTGKLLKYNSKHYVTYIRFEVFMAVTMKIGVFWDVTPCGSCKNPCFGGT